LVLIGASLVVIGVLIQAFSIVAYVRGAGETALDVHTGDSLTVHLGQLMIIIGALGAWFRNWKADVLVLAFLVLSVAQLFLIGDTDESGGWVNGLHGLLAIVVLLAGVAYGQVSFKQLGLRGWVTS
jgi:hypothetical protein